MLAFTINLLLTWRLTSLLVNEDGPFDLFVRFRDWIGIGYDEDGLCAGRNDIAKMLCCTRCTSVWVGLAVALLIPIGNPLAIGFSLSAGSIILDRLMRR